MNWTVLPIWNRGGTFIDLVTVRDDEFTRDVLQHKRWVIAANNDGCKGYPSVGEKGRTIYLHALVFAHYYGPLEPGCTIDHRNCDTFNATPENLRAATGSIQRANRGAHRINRSGFKGVYRLPAGSQTYWAAMVKKDGIKTYKSFPYTPEGKFRAAAYVNAIYEWLYPEACCPNPEIQAECERLYTSN